MQSILIILDVQMLNVFLSFIITAKYKWEKVDQGKSLVGTHCVVPTGLLNFIFILQGL